MPNFLEVARAIAAQDAKTNQVKLENALNREMLPYAGERARLANDLTKGQISEIPYMNAYRQAQTNAIPSEIEARLAQAALTRLHAKYLPMDYDIKQQQLGIDRVRYSPEAVNSLINYRNALIQTAPQRALSGYGKQIFEQDMTERGYSPTGSMWPQDRAPVVNAMAEDEEFAGVPFRLPEQRNMLNAPPMTEAQKRAANNYRNKTFKDSTDPELRSQLRAAANVEKTLQYIDPKILGKYAGLKGRGDLARDRVLSLLPGGEYMVSPEFNEYNKMVNIAVKMLASQMLRFNKDSIQGPVQEKYNFIANPDSWYSTPELAAEYYNELVDIMNNEIGTLHDAAGSPDIYYGNKKPTVEKNKPKNDSGEKAQASDADIKFTAKKYGISEAEVRKRLGVQ